MHEPKSHKPRYKFDCDRCKFNWCCGYTCVCVLRNASDPPLTVKKLVNQALLDAGFSIEFENI